MKRVVVLFLAILFPYVCFSQRNIKVKGNTYLHRKTGFELPKEIGKFNRSDIHAFDRKKEDIGANYVDGSTKVSVYVYPAYEGYEDRLRREFFRTLYEIVAVNDTEEQEFAIKCISHHSGQYLIHGLLTNFIYNGKKSLFSLYECGHWWLKFRITDNNSNETSLDPIEAQFRNSLDPSILISSNPLNVKVTVSFQKTAFRDSLMLGCVMGQALEKVKWMKENMDSLELQAGIPSLYLDYNIAGVDGAIDFVQKHPEMSSSSATNEMLDFLIAVKNEGYLEEMFFDEKQGGIIIPDSVVLDMDGYYKWLEDHTFNEDYFYDHTVIYKK